MKGLDHDGVVLVKVPNEVFECFLLSGNSERLTFEKSASLAAADNSWR